MAQESSQSATRRDWRADRADRHWLLPGELSRVSLPAAAAATWSPACPSRSRSGCSLPCSRQHRGDGASWRCSWPKSCRSTICASMLRSTTCRKACACSTATSGWWFATGATGKCTSCRPTWPSRGPRCRACSHTASAPAASRTIRRVSTANCCAAMAQGTITNVEVISAEGRTMSISNRPMAGGGWVATHEDITERRDAEQRARLDAGAAAARGPLSSRRSPPSAGSVEEQLRTVTDGALAMRSTATSLLANSGQTTKRADGAVKASNEASTNVESAAVAADELTGSIAEIGRQLSLTTDIVRARSRGAGHQRADRRAGAGRAEDRRRHQIDPRHRRADQSVGAQRHHRGRTRRRGRQGVRGGGLRSQIAGRADRQGDRRHFAS